MKPAILALAFIPLVHSHTASMISIPILGGLVGYAINWTGVWMLYRPLGFVGLRVPGLLPLVRRLPRKLQDVPGLKDGGIGWQGIIPSRAGKLGSVAVDTQIAKIGTPGEFYAQLDHDELERSMAEHLRGELRGLVEQVVQRDYPELWHDLPPRFRELIHDRVQDELPDVTREVVDQIGRHIDDLLDVKLMVIRLLQARPELTNRLFHEVGRKEFRFIINFGFVFGFLLGLPIILLVEALPYWWTLPAAQAVAGYVTNWLGILMIYEPVEARRIGPFRWQGLFPRRQHEAAATYAEIIAADVITVHNIGDELLRGPRSDRTQELIRSVLRPLVDRVAGRARAALEVAYGTERYEAARQSFVDEAMDQTVATLRDLETNERQNAAIRTLFTDRMRALPSRDFAETMRAATRQDEWLLLAHGAVFGTVGGLLHYVIFGV